VAVVSLEVAGFAKDGPTEAQQRSMVALWDELKARDPRAIPLGHRGQDVKACPGRTAGMKAAFAAMGGHGTSYSEVRDVSTRDYASGRIRTVRDGSKLFDYPGGLSIGTVDPPPERDYLGTDRSGDYALVGSVLEGKPRTAWVRVRPLGVLRVRRDPRAGGPRDGRLPAERDHDGPGVHPGVRADHDRAARA
jgi:hypothetical protein